MNEFVDPRGNPEPPARVSREPVAHGEELRELTQLCLAGRVYDVERWIREDQPIQALTYKRPKRAPVMSPLRAAVRKKQRDLVLLLLCNGYRRELEDQRWNSLLDDALTTRAFAILDLLLKWGADPTTATAYYVIDTYKSDLIDRFWTAGLDYAKDPEFVAHTVNKPLYGWLRGHRSDHRLQDVLDVALFEAVVEDEELTVRLLLWAGANPHRRAPTSRELQQPTAWTDDALWSSAEAAIASTALRALPSRYANGKVVVPIA